MNFRQFGKHFVVFVKIHFTEVKILRIRPLDSGTRCCCRGYVSFVSLRFLRARSLHSIWYQITAHQMIRYHIIWYDIIIYQIVLCNKIWCCIIYSHIPGCGHGNVAATTDGSGFYHKRKEIRFKHIFRFTFSLFLL